MMQLTIEGLKPKYKELAEAISRNNPRRDDADDYFCTLDEVFRIIICSTTTYEGMTAPQLVMNIEEDLRFVSGQMTEAEEQARIKFHWDLIEQQDKELREYMRQQKEKEG